MVTVSTKLRPAKSSKRQVVFSFDEITPASQSAAVRGGKGHHLSEMVALGLPVPPGFTVTTTVARAYQENGVLPKRFLTQLDMKLRNLERQTGKRFGDPANPLLVSVRSGAAASMPGMLDTVLNIGLTEEIVTSLARLAGEDFAIDTWNRFQSQFSQLMLDIPADPYDQLTSAIEAVMASWTSERAQAYRAAHGLPEWWGTAVNIQSMVFGNLDDQSGTGVVFSHDLTTGRPGLCGEFLPRAQGEDVVSGARTPLPIEEMVSWGPRVYLELVNYVKRLSQHFGDIVDIEFTVEKGELYLLQARRAKRTARVAVTYAVHEAWAKRITREEAVRLIPDSTVELLTTSAVAPCEDREEIASGLPASSGAVVGEVVFTSTDASRLASEGRLVILVTPDTSPEDLPGMLASVGLVTQTGGATCHAAVVARELGLPSVVGASSLVIGDLQEGSLITIDGSAGKVYAGELPLIRQELSKEENIFLRWRDRFISQAWIDFESLEGPSLMANELLNDVYLSDALVREAKGTQHSAPAEALRSEVHERVAGIFAAYLLVAVAGEVRYGYSMAQNSKIQPVLDKLDGRFQLAMNADRSAAQKWVVGGLKGADISAQIEFFELAEDVFRHGSWSAGYGGLKWAEIACTAKLYLSGKMTHTVFVDHVFDLRHNGGVLFNKHAVLNRTDEYAMHRQLDIKKSESTLQNLFRQLTRNFPSVSLPVQTMLKTVSPGIMTRDKRW